MTPEQQKALEQAQARLAELEKPKRRYPIQDGPSVPWEVMEPHERQAQRNHQQSLQRLAERGGLGASEAWAIVNDLDWNSKSDWRDWQAKWKEFADHINLHYDKLEQAQRERDEAQTRIIAQAIKYDAYIDELQAKLDASESERAKWEKAAIQNGDNCKAALRAQDDLRLDLLASEASGASLREALGMSSQWPVIDVLHTLANWCDHLSQAHDCDCNGHEVRGGGVKAARAMVEKLQNALSTTCDTAFLAERERMRKALKEIIYISRSNCRCELIAREALKETK